MKRPKYKFNGLLVKMLRIQLGISRVQLADTAGVSRKGLYNIEEGKSPNPRLAMIAALAEALDIEIQDLFYKVPPP